MRILEKGKLKETDADVLSLLNNINSAATSIARMSKDAMKDGTPEVLFDKYNSDFSDLNSSYDKLRDILNPVNQGE